MKQAILHDIDLCLDVDLHPRASLATALLSMKQKITNMQVTAEGEGQEPIAWFVERQHVGFRDHGMKLGPFWKLADAVEWVDDKHVLRTLHAAPQQRQTLPSAITQEANDAIESMLAKYNHPCNTQNAGRAGWEAARQYLNSAAPQQSNPPMDEQFEAWWQEHGQFCRAGGGDYEKTFAYRAWEAATKENKKKDIQ